MIINSELKNFVVESSKQHSPFKRKNDNEKYQSKYVEIFELIFSKLPDLESSIQIHVNNFQDTYRNYKDVLNDLYNDCLIYFYTSKNGSLIHGNEGFSDKNKGNYSRSFSSFYKLDLITIEQYKTNNYIKTNRIKQYKKKLKQYSKQINFTPNFFNEEIKYTENKWYQHLTYENGEKVMDELPKYGQYTDGRIYSKFHTMKREMRKRLRLCGSTITEVFDISHCYPTLIGCLIEGCMDEDAVSSYRKYIMENDIYLDALQEARLPLTKENRDKIKPYFNKFILSTIKDNKRNLKWESEDNDPKLFAGVVKFFKNNFPEVFEFIWNYNVEEKIVNGKKKKVKILAHHLQIIEKVIIDKLCSSIKDVPYITLHDAIYVAENDLEKVEHIEFENEFRKIIGF